MPKRRIPLPESPPLLEPGLKPVELPEILDNMHTTVVRRGKEHRITSKARLFARIMAEGVYTKQEAMRMAGFTTSNMNDFYKGRKYLMDELIAAERAKYAIASNMTKKQVLDGFKEAIDMAKIKAEPLTMIAGWREIGKLCGFYEPTKIQATVTVQDATQLHKLKTMTDEELLQLANNRDVIDAEYEEVSPEAGEEGEEGEEGSDS